MKSQTTQINSQIKKVKTILNEWVSRNSVADAINGRDVVTIYYDSPLDTTNNRGYRTIEPYVLGTSKKGNLVVRAWQQGGATDSGKGDDAIPGWRLFRLDGIKVFYKTFKKFDTTPEYIAANRPHYNPKDKDMISILVAADPNINPEKNIDGEKNVNDPDVVTVKNNKIVSPSVFNHQADKLRSFYAKPIPKLDNNWYQNIKSKFLSDINKI